MGAEKMRMTPGKERDGMRKYSYRKESDLEQVICNGCGKVMELKNGCLREECFHAEQLFGYFSNKDGSRQSFDLCETCYDEMIARFRVPVTVEQEAELI